MTPEQLRNFFSHGSPDPLPEVLAVRAGPLAMIFDSGDLRYIKFGKHEVIRRIYAAVRDHNWGTVPGVISNLNHEIGSDSFRIQYDCEHRENDIQFAWKASIHGETDGTIRFSFDGEAKSTFLRNRIGFCVLHPIECAGAKCRAIYADGSQKESFFPKTIAAEQPVPSLHDLAGLDHEIEPGVWLELRFKGDLFETEDQRNWIDASFKTFCTPLRLPFPAEIKAGTRITQEIRLRLSDTARVAHAKAVVTKSLDETTDVRVLASDRPLLPIGLSWASRRQYLTPVEIKRLAALNLGHVRVDVRPSESASSVQLTMAAADSEHIGTGIELAVHLDNLCDWPSAEAYLSALLLQLQTAARKPVRILIFGSAQDDSTPPEALTAARSVFAGLGISIGAGTNADLYQLNLQRPPADADLICWSMNPQVHAFDCTSIAETPQAAAQQVASVRAYFPGKPIAVSPITLKPRFNPVATTSEPTLPPDKLPAEVDPRQLSLFGAAWTLAMIKAVAEAGADSVTFYETVGWRGVMETETGSTSPEKFPSIPGAVFPLYHVFADVGEFAGGRVVLTETSNPLSVATLLLRKENRERLLLVNLSRETQKVALRNLGNPVRARKLDASNVRQAMTVPEDFRRATHELSQPEVTLEPFALATIDFANSK